MSVLDMLRSPWRVVDWWDADATSAGWCPAARPGGGRADPSGAGTGPAGRKGCHLGGGTGNHARRHRAPVLFQVLVRQPQRYRLRVVSVAGGDGTGGGRGLSGCRPGEQRGKGDARQREDGR